MKSGEITVGDRAESFVEHIGDRMVRLFQLLGLFMIGATIVWSGGIRLRRDGYPPQGGGA